VLPPPENKQATYYTYLPRPPVEAALPILMLHFFVKNFFWGEGIHKNKADCHEERIYKNYLKSSYKKNPTRCSSVSKFISYLYEAQHVSSDTPSIIRSLKLH
jgi:hypothetical protein